MITGGDHRLDLIKYVGQVQGRPALRFVLVLPMSIGACADENLWVECGRHNQVSRLRPRHRVPALRGRDAADRHAVRHHRPTSRRLDRTFGNLGNYHSVCSDRSGVVLMLVVVAESIVSLISTDWIPNAPIIAKVIAEYERVVAVPAP